MSANMETPVTQLASLNIPILNDLKKAAEFLNVEQPVANTDIELFREIPGDHYSNSLHVTSQGRIGINVGGTVKVRSLQEWFSNETKLNDLRNICSSFIQALNMIKEDYVKSGDLLKGLGVERIIEDMEVRKAKV